jgi:hypothetical protein
LLESQANGQGEERTTDDANGWNSVITSATTLPLYFPYRQQFRKAEDWKLRGLQHQYEDWPDLQMLRKGDWLQMSHSHRWTRHLASPLAMLANDVLGHQMYGSADLFCAQIRSQHS